MLSLLVRAIMWGLAVVRQICPVGPPSGGPIRMVGRWYRATLCRSDFRNYPEPLNPYGLWSALSVSRSLA